MPLRIHGVRDVMGPLRSSVTKFVIEPKQTGKLEVVLDTLRFSGSKTLSVFLAHG